MPLTSMKKTPQQGEIWVVNFDPTRGAEIKKPRPARVVSADDIGVLPLRIVVPITQWDASRSNLPWFVPLTPSPTNGLKKPSGADAFQVKSVSVERFIEKLGSVTGREFMLVIKAITLCLEPSEELSK